MARCNLNPGVQVPQGLRVGDVGAVGRVANLLRHPVNLFDGLLARRIIHPRERPKVGDVHAAHVGHDLVAQLPVARGKGGLDEETGQEPAQAVGRKRQARPPARRRGELAHHARKALTQVVKGLEDVVVVGGEDGCADREDGAPDEITLDRLARGGFENFA